CFRPRPRMLSAALTSTAFRWAFAMHAPTPIPRVSTGLLSLWISGAKPKAESRNEPLLTGNRVVCRNQSPLAGFLHPHIGEAVAVIIGLLRVHAFFMIDTDHDRGVTMYSNLHLRDLYHFDVRR